MCLTYGRPHLLEEAIASFLRQDYAGVKELIVLNDLPEQRLHFDHPEVKIINVEKRFRGVGEKRNACAALCSHDLLCPWDDDDISLPWRISHSVEKLADGRRFFKPAQSFILSGTTLTGPQENTFHASACWERALFDEVNGYPHKEGTGEDIGIERKFARVLGGAPLSEMLPVEQNFYIYRWAGTNSYHLSGFDSPSDYRMVGDFVARQLAASGSSPGTVLLNPRWMMDYPSAVTRYLTKERLASSAG